MSKTSIGKVLKGVEYTYEGPISIFKGRGYQGGVSRTMFLTPTIDQLENMPEELFVVKISQSQNPDRAGKALFRFFTFRTSSDEKYSDLVPKGVTQTTPLAEIKEKVIKTLKQIDGAEVSITVPLHGTFTTVDLADGRFDIYNEAKFPSDDIKTLGEPPYYIKPDATMAVTLKGAENLGNEYFQSRISSPLSADDVFQKKAAGKIWGEEDSTGASEPATSDGDVW